MDGEQLEGKDADARADMFAFGAVLYESLSGRRALEGKSQATLIAAIIDREPTPLATLLPLFPSALDRVIRTCLAKDPDQRWQNAADLRRELAWIAENKEAPVEAAAKGARSARKLPWLLVGTAVGILLGILGGTLLHRGPTTNGSSQLAGLTIPANPPLGLGANAEPS